MQNLLKKIERVKTLKHDEKKVDLLNEIAFGYQLVEVVKMKEFAQKALELSSSIGYIKGKARANINLGIHSYYVGSMSDLLAYNQIGFELASQIEDYGLLCSATNNLGLYYQSFYELGKAMEWYLKAIDYAEKAKKFNTKAMTLNNIGNMFADNLNDDKGKYYYELAIKCAESANAFRALGLANSNLVELYLKDGDLVRSKPIIEKIGLIAEQTNSEFLKCHYWMRLSDYHLKDEKPQLAILALEENLKISIKVGIEIQKIDTYLDLAKLYLLQENFDIALRYANTGFELAWSNSNQFRIELYYSILAEIHTKKANYKKATEYYKKYIELGKVLKREEKEKIVLELEGKYQIEKNELENALLKSQQRENETTINAQRAYNDLLAKEVAFKAKLNAELERSNQDLERFAHIASHDIKSPLRTIGGFAQLLNKTATNKLNDKEKKFLEFIYTTSGKLANLIDDLLAYSKINSQKIKLSKVDLKQLMNEIKATFLPEAKEKGIELSIVGEFPEIMVDKIKLERVFQNLISNAMKFYDLKKESIIKISCQELDDAWEFKVFDNGIGIEKTDQNIFEPFTYLNNKKSYEGTGIGLTLCKRTIEQHGGTIFYESEFGKETCFFFSIAKNIITLAA